MKGNQTDYRKVTERLNCNIHCESFKNFWKRFMYTLREDSTNHKLNLLPMIAVSMNDYWKTMREAEVEVSRKPLNRKSRKWFM